MTARLGSGGRKGYLLFVGGAAILLALSFANVSFLAAGAIAGGVLLAALVLKSPAAVLVAGVAAGPTLGSWLDVTPGGGIPAITIDRVLIVAVLFYMSIRWLRRRSSLLPVGRAEIFMAVFVAIALASAYLRAKTMANTVSTLRTDMVFLAITYAAPFLLFFLAKHVLQEHHLRWVLRSYVAVGLFVAGIAILEHFTDLVDISARYDPTQEGPDPTYRAVGTLGSAAHYGIVMVTSLLAAVVVFMRSRGLPRRSMLMAAIGVMLFSVLLSKTRAVYLGLIIATAVSSHYIPKMRRPLAILALSGLTAFIVLSPFVTKSAFVTDRMLEMEPIYNRVALWGTATNMFLHKPIAGFGFGRKTFIEERSDYYVSVGTVSPEWATRLGLPHSEYLHVLLLLGLIGFIPYVSIIVSCWRSTTRALKKAAHRPELTDTATVTLSAFSAYLFAALFAEVSGVFYGSNMVYFLLGAVAGGRVRASPAVSTARPAR